MSSEEDEELMMLLLFLFLFTVNLWWRRRRIEIDIVVDLVLVYIKPLDLMKKTKNVVVVSWTSDKGHSKKKRQKYSCMLENDL